MVVFSPSTLRSVSAAVLIAALMSAPPPADPPTATDVPDASEPAQLESPTYFQHPTCLSWGAPALDPPAGTAFSAHNLRLIGGSVEGRPLWAEHYGPHDAPQVFVVAHIHGNECAPGFLVEAVRSSPPDDFGVWLIPSINPDGQAAFTRNNANGVNLNRDGGSRRAPETNALLDFTAEIQPVLTLHAHSPLGWLGWYGAGDYGASCRSCADGDLPARVIHGARELPGADSLGADGAGRKSHGEWYLWQGQQDVAPGTSSVLVEFRPIHRSEVPGAPGRARVASPDEQRWTAAAIWSSVADQLQASTS